MGVRSRGIWRRQSAFALLLLAFLSTLFNGYASSAPLPPLAVETPQAAGPSVIDFEGMTAGEMVIGGLPAGVGVSGPDIGPVSITGVAGWPMIFDSECPDEENPGVEGPDFCEGHSPPLYADGLGTSLILANHPLGIGQNVTGSLDATIDLGFAQPMTVLSFTLHDLTENTPTATLRDEDGLVVAAISILTTEDAQPFPGPWDGVSSISFHLNGSGSLDDIEVAPAGVVACPDPDNPDCPTEVECPDGSTPVDTEDGPRCVLPWECPDGSTPGGTESDPSCVLPWECADGEPADDGPDGPRCVVAPECGDGSIPPCDVVCPDGSSAVGDPLTCELPWQCPDGSAATIDELGARCVVDWVCPDGTAAPLVDGVPACLLETMCDDADLTPPDCEAPVTCDDADLTPPDCAAPTTCADSALTPPCERETTERTTCADASLRPPDCERRTTVSSVCADPALTPPCEVATQCADTGLSPPDCIRDTVCADPALVAPDCAQETVCADPALVAPDCVRETVCADPGLPAPDCARDTACADPGLTPPDCAVACADDDLELPCTQATTCEDQELTPPCIIESYRVLAFLVDDGDDGVEDGIYSLFILDDGPRPEGPIEITVSARLDELEFTVPDECTASTTVTKTFTCVIDTATIEPGERYNVTAKSASTSIAVRNEDIDVRAKDGLGVSLAIEQPAEPRTLAGFLSETGDRLLDDNNQRLVVLLLCIAALILMLLIARQPGPSEGHA